MNPLVLEANGRQPRLRPMCEADLEAVIAVERAGYAHPWTLGIFRDCLDARHHCWVWEQEGELIGHGVMSAAAGESHILNLCVHPDHQGDGLGRRMLRHLLHLARRHGADISLLEVRPSNEAAVRLYLSEGYDEVGRRRGYYPAGDRREDALVLARTLVEHEVRGREEGL